MNLNGKVALVVGASSGIGRKLAIRLAGEGALVVATARRKDRLDGLADEIWQGGGACTVHAADAEDPSAAERVVQVCVRQHGRIDMVFLNAGGAPAIDMRELGAREVTAYMRSNYDVAVNYLFPVLHQMKAQRAGLVFQTNSLAGFLGVPLQGPYSAAKGALRLLIDTCRLEFGEFGIRFVSVYPGFIATEATANDGMPPPMALSETQAVDYLMHALRRKRWDYLFPFSMRWLIRLAMVLPKRVTHHILRREVPAMASHTVHCGGAPMNTFKAGDA